MANNDLKYGSIKYNKTLSGKEWREMRRKCIYLWFRKNRCLYIGKSDRGFSRFLSVHHVLDKCELVLDDDTIRVLYISDSAPDALDFVEQLLIKRFRPVYNVTHNNTTSYASKTKTTTDHSLPKLQRGIYSKEEVAKVLLNDVPESILLGHPQDSSNLSPLTRAEKLKELDQIRELKNVFASLDGKR